MKTNIFRLNRKALFGLMVLAAAGAMPVQAATINVNTVADTISDDGFCSLREAVIAANTNSPSGASPNECAAGDAGPVVDVINLAALTYTLNLAAPVGSPEDWYVASGADPEIPYVLDSNPDASVGDLDLTESVSIVGQGMASTIIDGSTLDRIFQVVDPTNSKTVNVTISNLTVRNGMVGWTQIPDSQVGDSYWLFKKLGGGIATGVAAAVTQYIPEIHGPGTSDAGQYQQMGEPGGDEEVGATYSLTLNDVKVAGNVSAADGGGLYNIAAFTADRIVVDGNTAGANGGGLYNEAKTIIRGSIISNNAAEGGGGIFFTGSASSPVYVIKTSVLDNVATGGGGISGRNLPTLYVTNSTVSGNTGNDVGGGIYANGSAFLVNSTIADNRGAPEAADNAPGGAGLNTFGPGSFTLWNTLLANNTKLAVGSEVVANCGISGGGGVPNIISKGQNLESLASTCANLVGGTNPGLTAATNDLFGAGVDAMLAPRDPVVGFYALTMGSSAINNGDSSATFQDGSGSEVPVTDDQVGTARPAGQFDIGAYELASANSTGGGGGGCAAVGNGRLDPTFPALLAAGLAFFGWRRFRSPR